jgi:hypothetical protein
MADDEYYDDEYYEDEEEYDEEYDDQGEEGDRSGLAASTDSLGEDEWIPEKILKHRKEKDVRFRSSIIIRT